MYPRMVSGVSQCTNGDWLMVVTGVFESEDDAVDCAEFLTGLSAYDDFLNTEGLAH